MRIDFEIDENDEYQLQKLLNKANDGEAESQFILGLLFIQGSPTPNNDTEAFKRLQQAAERGHSWYNLYFYKMNRQGTEWQQAAGKDLTLSVAVLT